MDTTVTNQEKFEAFKATIFKWKNEHREDYNEFARQMDNCNEKYYCQIFRTIMFRAPHIAKEWKLSCHQLQTGQRAGRDGTAVC